MFLLVVALPLVFTPFSASPFGDPKLVIMVAGTLALWASGLPTDRKLGTLAVAWVAVTAVAALAGVEPIRSLTARTEGQGGGLVLTLCCATLVVVGSAIPEELRGRARRWLTISGAIVVSAVPASPSSLCSATRASVSTTAPRDTLTSRADAFIFARRSAFTYFFVCGDTLRWTEMMSLSLNRPLESTVRPSNAFGEAPPRSW